MFKWHNSGKTLPPPPRVLYFLAFNNSACQLKVEAALTSVYNIKTRCRGAASHFLLIALGLRERRFYK
jgi:hypothetical protein